MFFHRRESPSTLRESGEILSALSPRSLRLGVEDQGKRQMPVALGIDD
jgi:hypothetical protein